jgi:uncharacterized protein YndB with AHSA1/START domain
VAWATRLTMALETFEPKNGGSWLYIHKDQDGNEYAFHGVYHEVTAPERIIQTFEFEGLPEKGINDSYHRLSELLEKMNKENV